MKLSVIKIGKIAYPEIKKLAEIYEERLRAVIKINNIEIRDDSQAIKLIQKYPSDHKVILLDERGPQWSSTELARNLSLFSDDPSIKALSFLIAGPMGPHPGLKKIIPQHWSLSRATLTSDMTFLLVWEQIYRAYSILKGTSYHHD